MTIGNHPVNTDATRQENVLDFIGNIAQHVQVLIVMCHGERYRGTGVRQQIKEADRLSFWKTDLRRNNFRPPQTAARLLSILRRQSV